MRSGSSKAIYRDGFMASSTWGPKPNGGETVGFCLLARPRKTPFCADCAHSYDAAAISQCSFRFIVFTTCVSTASVALLTFFYSRHLCFIFTSDILEAHFGESMARPLRLFTPEPSITLPREIADRKRIKVRPVLRKSGRAF